MLTRCFPCDIIRRLLIVAKKGGKKKENKFISFNRERVKCMCYHDAQNLSWTVHECNLEHGCYLEAGCLILESVEEYSYHYFSFLKAVSNLKGLLWWSMYVHICLWIMCIWQICVLKVSKTWVQRIFVVSRMETGTWRDQGEKESLVST